MMYSRALESGKKIFAVAPMMDWTDKHCRYFHRQLTKKSLLYTEMVVAEAVIHGDRNRLLGFNETEHPVAIQIGGSDPGKLGQAAEIGAGFGYDEVNLNVGCPSDRVQSGTFGACLMREPELVGNCVAAMKDAVSVPVTVKCRIGVDEQDPEIALSAISENVFGSGADAIWVHARIAWLDGLSPKENRDVPPLDYEIVYRLKEKFPCRFIGINGGVESLNQAVEHLRYVDGVMLGRAAYRNPALLAGVDALLSGGSDRQIIVPEFEKVIEAMAEYAQEHVEGGGRLSQVTRHMTGLFSGTRGARMYRQILSTRTSRPDANANVLWDAFACIDLNGNKEGLNAA